MIILRSWIAAFVLLLATISPSSARIAFSPDGRYLVYNGEVIDLPTGETIANLDVDPIRHISPNAVAFSPDGSLAAALYLQIPPVIVRLRIFDTSDWSVLQEVVRNAKVGSFDAPNVVEFSQNGEFLIWGSSNMNHLNTVKTRDIHKNLNKSLFSFNDSIGYVNDRHYFRFTEQDRTIYIVNARSGREHALKIKCGVRRLATIAGNIGVTVCKDHVDVVSLTTGASLFNVDERVDDIESTSLASDRVVTYGDDGKFRLVSVYGWSTLSTLKPKHPLEGVWAVSSDGKLLAAEEYFKRLDQPRRERGLFLYSLTDGKLLQKLR